MAGKDGGRAASTGQVSNCSSGARASISTTTTSSGDSRSCRTKAPVSGFSSWTSTTTLGGTTTATLTVASSVKSFSNKTLRNSPKRCHQAHYKDTATTCVC